MSNIEADDSKASNSGKIGCEGKGKQTVTKSYVVPHQISAQDMCTDTKNIYRNYNEVVYAVKDKTFNVGKTTCWKNGRLYFLCTRK